MSHLFRIPVAVVFLLALGLSGIAAPADYDLLQAQKVQSVRAVLPALGSDVEAQVIEEAATRAVALSTLQIDSAASRPTVTFGFSGAPLYAARIEQAPLRLVIDFADTILLTNLQTMTIDGGNAIVNVDTAMIGVHPQFVCRTVIELNDACAIGIEQKNAAVILTFDPNAPHQSNPVIEGSRHDAIALAAIKEQALRTDAAAREGLAEVDATLAAATRFIDRAKVALIRSELAEISPASDARHHDASTGNLRQAMTSHGDLTRELKNDYLLLLSNRDLIRAEARVHVVARSADADFLASALRDFSNDERAFADRLAEFNVRLARQLKANERLAQRAEQQRVGFAAAFSDARPEMKFNELDRAFLALRETAKPEVATRDTLATADKATESVEAASVDLAMYDDTRMAVLTSAAKTPDTLAAPPTRRVRRSSSSFARNLIENPIKMAVLRSSSADLQSAENNGILVMAQQQTTGITEAQGRPATPVQAQRDATGPRRFRVPKASGARPQFSLYNEGMPADQDPLRQLVNIDFREMDLSNVVSLLAQKGEINVIAGTEVSGTVTANLKNIPLGRAIEIVLRMNGLGIVEEAGVYRITTYEDAISAQRETKMIFLKNAQAEDVKATLDDVLTNATNGDLVSVSANPATNIIILSGPRESVDQLEGVIAELDIAEPVVPTITSPIKLNYSEPIELLMVVEKLLSDEGSVTADTRSRHLIVTDIPVKVQEIEALIASIDLPVKQVSIDAMIVDAQLDDDAQTGVEWLLKSVKSKQDLTSSTFETEDGVLTTNTEGNFVPKVGFANAFLPSAAGSQLFFKVLSGDIDLSAIIAAEVSSRNAELLANPTIVTVENKPAVINITQEFPYQELTQTSEGGSIGTTKFKEIGTILTVTPRVTHDNHIIAAIEAKESTVVGFTSAEVPIEAKREATTTLRLRDGQTIFIGGMRSYEDRLTVRKTPILGDIPILNFLFSHKRSEQTNTELLIFLTCSVLPDDMPELTPYEKRRFDELGGTPQKVDGTRALVRSYIHPEDQRDPFYKWKRTK